MGDWPLMDSCSILKRGRAVKRRKLRGPEIWVPRECGLIYISLVESTVSVQRNEMRY